MFDVDHFLPYREGYSRDVHFSRVKTRFYKSNLPVPHSARLGMLAWLVAGQQASPALYALSGEFRRPVTP